MNTTTNSYDETTNHDLPGEIEDLHDGNCEVMIIDDPYGDEDWRDPSVWDDEDDSWSDSDSLASCGWGEDEAYGCFE